MGPSWYYAENVDENERMGEAWPGFTSRVKRGASERGAGCSMARVRRVCVCVRGRVRAFESTSG
jgi:hypothetical protein